MKIQLKMDEMPIHRLAAFKVTRKVLTLSRSENGRKDKLSYHMGFTKFLLLPVMWLDLVPPDLGILPSAKEAVGTMVRLGATLDVLTGL